MGLAPYGIASSENVQKFARIIRETLVDIKDDGSLWLNQEYFSYATGLRMVDDAKWERLFGFPRRPSESKIEQHHCDCAFAIQQVTEEIVLKMAREAKRLTGATVPLSRGRRRAQLRREREAAAREALRRSLHPARGGGCGGGGRRRARRVLHLFRERARTLSGARDEMRGAYLGPEYSDGDIEQVGEAVQGGLPEVRGFRRAHRHRGRSHRGRVPSWAGSRGGWNSGRGRSATAAFSGMRATSRCRRSSTSRSSTARDSGRSPRPCSPRRARALLRAARRIRRTCSSSRTS